MEEYKKTIQKILEVIIISFVSFGLISNLESMIHIRKKYSYDFESAVEISIIRTTIEDLKLDLEQIKNKQNSHLTEEQLNKFEEYLSNTIDDIEKFSFIKENKIKSYTEKEWMNILLNYNKIGYTSLIDTYRQLAEYDSKLQEGQKAFIERIYYMMISGTQIYQQLYDNYQYGRINHFTNQNNFLPNMVLETFVEKLNTIEYISNLVINDNKELDGVANE